MDTVTLCQLACSDKMLKKTFGGVYASDALPKSKKNFSSFIVNLDRQSSPGSHWVAIYFQKRKSYYFDSYGLPPKDKNILIFLKNNANTILYNKVCFQDNYTVTCGKFCLYFLFQSVRQRRLDDLHEKNKGKNETFIKKFVRNNFERWRSNCCRFAHQKNQKCKAWINIKSSWKRYQ